MVKLRKCWSKDQARNGSKTIRSKPDEKKAQGPNILDPDSNAAFGIVVRDSTAYNRGWLNAIVESDSQVAISLSSLESPPPWSLAALVDDIRFWAKSMPIPFSWVNRERNQVADWVARYAFSNTLEFSWDVYFPDELPRFR
uniref:F-box domain, FBD domain, leucine-rich repeat domain, L domain-like protein n=1 Tax=Tanacetum cinerariifolium TaxID=118510 RepID=A0A699HN21_TANCI|nr:F-box domain, FBD domain, leucine-rich repeat domain, L domain-like protein [Tanacetum cinerariifolium]